MADIFSGQWRQLEGFCIANIIFIDELVLSIIMTL